MRTAAAAAAAAVAGGAGVARCGILVVAGAPVGRHTVVLWVQGQAGGGVCVMCCVSAPPPSSSQAFSSACTRRDPGVVAGCC